MDTHIDINIEVLKYLIKSERLEKDSSAQGIARQIIADKGLEKLSEKQMYVFNNEIFPLLKPECEGVYGDGPNSCSGDGFVDNESLLLSYLDIEDHMLCQFCRYDKHRHDLE